MSARAAQLRMNGGGYDVGPADGIIGPRFLNALDRLIADAKLAKGSPAELQPSARIIAFVKGFEKCRLTAYLPTPDDVPTIGWGSTGPDIHLGMTWNQAEADARFEADARDFAASVRRSIAGAPTTQDQFDAMFSLAYNIGKDGFRSSTLLRLHRAGDYAGAAAQFQRWNRQKGKILNGLTRRREAEAAIYRGDA